MPLTTRVDLSDWIEEHHPGQIGLTRAAKTAGPSFSIVLTHRAAIMLLLRYKCATSAFALLRSVYESADWTMTIGCEEQGETIHYFADVHRDGVRICRLALTASQHLSRMLIPP